MITIALAADHGGFTLKNSLRTWLSAQGYRVIDLGAHTAKADDDYPDYAVAAAKVIKEKKADFALLFCRTGTGMYMAANRFPFVRAAMLYSAASAKKAREHEDANVAAIGTDTFPAAQNKRFIKTFLSTKFDADARHARRTAKLAKLPKM